VPFLNAASDNGFKDPNTLSSLSVLFATAPFTNDGPHAHGAGFDFRFDPLAVAVSYSFNIYYRAAENTIAAEDAVSKVAGEACSFGRLELQRNVFLLPFVMDECHRAP
jgi:hypothetical protein